MKNPIRFAAVALVGIAIRASSTLCATKIATTAARDPVAPKKSIGQTILSAPAFIIKIPISLVKRMAKTYGSKSSLMCGVGFRFRDVWTNEDQVRANHTYLFPGEPVLTAGALSMLDGEPWLFSAQVVEHTQVLRIDRETFLDVASDHPGIMEGILRSLTSQIRRLVDAPLSDPRSQESQESAGN